MSKTRTSRSSTKPSKDIVRRRPSVRRSAAASDKGDFSRYILNCLPSPDPQNDWTPGDAASAGLLTATAIPSAKDLRESWWEIGDQGATGSCVGWATADSVVRWHFVKAGSLASRELLSTRYVWMASKETDVFVSRPTTFIESDGTSLKAALDVCRNFGVVLDASLPFQNGVLFQGSSNSFYALAAQRRIASYFNLGRDLSEWRTWIAKNGPILTRLDVDATWFNASTNNGNLDLFQPLTTRGGHAIALVGYTADRFIVRNSWGKTWGDKGFAYASNAYAAAAFTEAYGVVL